MKKYTLNADKRTVVGRKVKTLRASGQIPATVYGKNVESMNIAVPHAEFVTVYDSAGETGVVDLSVDGTSKPVLIHTVQVDPVDSTILHIEFHQVDLKEKVKTKVPLEVTGESPAAADKRGVVLSILSEVDVEALPTDLPESIPVDVSGLSEVDQEITVSQLKAPSGVVILTDPDVTVVKIGALVSREAEAQAAEEAQVAEEASTEAEAPSEEGEEGQPAEKSKESASAESPPKQE